MKVLATARHISWLAFLIPALLPANLVATASAAPLRPLRNPPLDAPADSTRVQQVRLLDGTLLVGRIRYIEGDSIRFETLSGNRFVFSGRDVRSVETARGKLMDGEFWADDPADSRLFFGPTARVLPHGRGYAGIYELFFPSAAVGIADRFMVTGGVSAFPGVPIEEQIGFISPKVQLLKTEPVQASIGTFTVTGFWLNGGATAGYAVVTGGDARFAVTGGVAIPFVEDEDFNNAYLFGGAEIRVSRRVKLMGEGWLGRDGDPGIYLVGMRLIVDDYSLELAGLLPEGSDVAVPLVSLTVGW